MIDILVVVALVAVVFSLYVLGFSIMESWAVDNGLHWSISYVSWIGVIMILIFRLIRWFDEMGMLVRL